MNEVADGLRCIDPLDNDEPGESVPRAWAINLADVLAAVNLSEGVKRG